MRCEMNQQEADYLMNCSVYEYYYRLKVYNQAQEKVKEQMEKASKSK